MQCREGDQSHSNRQLTDEWQEWPLTRDTMGVDEWNGDESLIRTSNKI